MSLNFISTDEAKKIIAEQIVAFNSVTVPLQDAAGKILANDIYAPQNIPAFPQSGMDGYALAYDSIGGHILLEGEQAAGSNNNTYVNRGTAVRIFTGAVVPNGADTVVMQEKVKIKDGYLQIENGNLKQGDNVRLPGTEIAKDALALPAGSLLTPAAIGFIAGMGISAINVLPNPKVSIIVTGNELQKPGTDAIFGKVYESNSYALLAALNQLGITDVEIHEAEDNKITLTHVLSEALNKSDLVLMTGGVSVGDYDFTVIASENCGVQKVFHNIKQKPGKPIFFGKKDKVIFFGLPGNPASVLTCFYQYVLIALEGMTTKKLQLVKQNQPISSSYKKPAGITHYLKGIFDGEKVQLPDGQESYKLNSFARANCLIMIPENTTEVHAGEIVEIHLLP
jgi:molybdopterin molybdotransferase